MQYLSIELRIRSSTKQSKSRMVSTTMISNSGALYGFRRKGHLDRQSSLHPRTILSRTMFAYGDRCSHPRGLNLIPFWAAVTGRPVSGRHTRDGYCVRTNGPAWWHPIYLAPIWKSTGVRENGRMGSLPLQVDITSVSFQFLLSGASAYISRCMLQATSIDR